MQAILTTSVALIFNKFLIVVALEAVLSFKKEKKGNINTKTFRCFGKNVPRTSLLGHFVFLVDGANAVSENFPINQR